MYKGLLIFVSFIYGFAGAQAQDLRFSGVKLKTIEGKKCEWKEVEKLSVLVFLSPGCPLSQKYTLTLNELAKEFQGKVKFYGVFADAHPAIEEYKNFQKKYGIQFPLLVDREKKLVKTLAARVTPESFVMKEGKLIYHGAIDDWAIELGKTRNKATINFVRNAVQCAMANTTPFPTYNKPVGCFID